MRKEIGHIFKVLHVNHILKEVVDKKLLTTLSPRYETSKNKLVKPTSGVLYALGIQVSLWHHGATWEPIKKKIT